MFQGTMMSLSLYPVISQIYRIVICFWNVCMKTRMLADR